MFLSKRYGILIAMTCAFAMIMLDNSIVSIAMPYMQGDLNLSNEHLIWVFNIYILTFATGVAVCGRLGDVYGHIKMFVGGISVFTFASILCALAPNGELLILARMLQALGAALMQPSSITIVFQSFATKNRAKALAIYVGIGLSFLAMGPIIGGFLTSFLSWRWIFYINVPIAFISVTMLYFYRPKQDKLTKTRLDRYGILLIILALPLLILPFEQVNQWGLLSPKTIGTFCLGLFFLIWFYRHERKHPAPIIDVSIFHNKLFIYYTIILCSTTFALVSSTVFNAIYLQNVMGFEPYVAGYYLLFIVGPNILAGQITGYLYDRFGLSILTLLGTSLMALSFFGISYAMASQNLNMLLTCYVGAGLGTGLVMSSLNMEMMLFAPSHRTGEISGLLQTLRLMGGTVGVAILSSLILFYEELSLKFIIYKYNIAAEYLPVLKRLLSESSDEQVRLSQAFTSETPALLYDLQEIVASSISKGFLLSACLLCVAALLSMFSYRICVLKRRN